MSRGTLNKLMASADPAMIVVTTVAENEQAGCLVGFHAQSSIAAEHYCLWLSKANHTYRTGLRATHLAVHFLTESDFSIAEWFGTRTGETADKFADLDVDTSEYGLPLLREWAVSRNVDSSSVISELSGRPG